MGFPTVIKAVVCYIESHLDEARLDYGELERLFGYSGAHLRELFRRETGVSLARYQRQRRVMRSAWELLHTDKTVLEIGAAYGFANPETYARAFRGVTGLTPSRLRSRNRMGSGCGSSTQEQKGRSDGMNRENTGDSKVIYGVPRIFYGAYGGVTPYPMCLKACADFLGDKVSYTQMMAGSGAAFRFVWNQEAWDLSNVDIYHTFTESNDVYCLGGKALGREFSFLERGEDTTKEAFLEFIKARLEQGYPCIALGVIGPPEACLVTGYRRGGEELLGWNCFQENPEFAASVTKDESGYFIARGWWENTDTQAVMCIGPKVGEPLGVREVLENAVKAMTPRQEGAYAKGLAAYAAWREAMGREEEYNTGGNYSLLLEKMMCHNDAMNCLEDGRYHAAAFFRQAAKATGEEGYGQIGEEFARCAEELKGLRELFDTLSGMDKAMKLLADRDVRQQACQKITLAEQADARALEMMRKVLG